MQKFQYPFILRYLNKQSKEIKVYTKSNDNFIFYLQVFLLTKKWKLYQLNIKKNFDKMIYFWDISREHAYLKNKIN